jgi:hypothetical protein
LWPLLAGPDSRLVTQRQSDRTAKVPPLRRSTSPDPVADVDTGDTRAGHTGDTGTEPGSDTDDEYEDL